MKKILTGALCLFAAVSLSLTALADPVVAYGGYTAYLGEGSEFFLEDSTGVTKVLHMPVANIVDVTDTHAYCLTQEGQLLGIALDGSSTVILSANPTLADTAALKRAPVFTLTGTTLVHDGKTLSDTALMACANSETIFWVESGDNGATTLKSLSLAEADAAPQTLGDGVASPLSMIATDETLTMVAGDHTVTVVRLIDRSRETLAATDATAAAASIGSKVFQYSLDDQGRYATLTQLADLALVSVATDEPRAAATTPSTVPSASPQPTATARPTASPTAKPTAKPTATPKPASDSEYSRINKGASGSAVRKMQKRLAELGYPVGAIDGVYGDDTALAVNLFQYAIGYTEHSYASAKMQEKLYSRKAPIYDPCAPLQEGNSGTPVLIMQNTLQIMGYNPGKLDGVYGKDTIAAVMIFQAVANLEVTGIATRETLELLYSPECPMNPSVYATPTPIPTQVPTEAPTETPTDVPTEAPTETPTEVPTEESTEAPTEAPTEESTEAPTETPTEAPTEAPTEVPAEVSTEAPIEESTEAPADAIQDVDPSDVTDEPTI